MRERESGSEMKEGEVSRTIEDDDDDRSRSASPRLVLTSIGGRRRQSPQTGKSDGPTQVD